MTINHFSPHRPSLSTRDAVFTLHPLLVVYLTEGAFIRRISHAQGFEEKINPSPEDDHKNIFYEFYIHEHVRHLDRK